ncbi:putative aliphatic sulfonates transport permease protein SsuC [Ruminiclostridium hungatei]|uniref:Putative aliphatic sulfonates transport permease protein SsuC n=1 Tax=Ruminiclostridium hungatei TaxID=48256 RepID=A0A1V4SHV7_RUMHU|nr:ABC transporter permease [Ruminiclostridium hungatei]OPX43343.1 putative aliphatic sulfonates transport permease protein SsuC [Ruminiclostridium hungatei]
MAEAKSIYGNQLRSKQIKILTKLSHYPAALIVPIVILIFWEIMSRNGYVKALILPAPSGILDAYIELIKSGRLFDNLLISIFRVAQGYVVGAVLGVAVGILIGLFKRVEIAFSIVLGFLRPIPIIAWMPVLILWMGIDEGSKVAVIAIGSFWPILINVVSGIRSVDDKYLEVAYIFEKNKIQILLKIVLPSALPSIFTGLRVGIGIAWMCVVGAELIASASGIGYLIMSSREMLQPDIMFAGVFSIGLIGLLIDSSLRIIEKRLLKWNSNANS